MEKTDPVIEFNDETLLMAVVHPLANHYHVVASALEINRLFQENGYSEGEEDSAVFSLCEGADPAEAEAVIRTALSALENVQASS